jgi:hypothetical protein
MLDHLNTCSNLLCRAALASTIQPLDPADIPKELHRSGSFVCGFSSSVTGLVFCILEEVRIAQSFSKDFAMPPNFGSNSEF